MNGDKICGIAGLLPIIVLIAWEAAVCMETDGQ